MGELAGSVRILNSAIGGALIVVYLHRAPTRNDRVDRVVVLSLLLFSIAGAASSLPRQSLDAVLGAFAFAAAFYVGRDVTANRMGSRATIAMLRLLSVTVTTLFVAQVAAVNIEWIRLLNRPPPTDWTAIRGLAIRSSI